MWETQAERILGRMESPEDERGHVRKEINATSYMAIHRWIEMV